MVKATSEKSSGFYRVKGESIHIRTENNSLAVVTVLGRQTQLTMLGTNSAGAVFFKIVVAQTCLSSLFLLRLGFLGPLRI